MTQPTISEKMSIGRKIGLLLDHLQAGGEVTINGRTWVWLDNHVTRTTIDENGERQYWGIDGLAIKGIQIDSKTREEKPHYMGQGVLPFQSFVELVEDVSEEDWVGMCGSNALKSMNKKR